EDDRVLERSTQCETALAKHLDFFEESECPRRRDLVDERLFVEVERLLLVPQEWMVERDRVADFEPVRRVQRDALVAMLHLNRPENLNRLTRRGELAHAGVVLNEVDPGRRAAVHDRHFRMVELDRGVVDAEAAQRREQMLNRLD